MLEQENLMQLRAMVDEQNLTKVRALEKVNSNQNLMLNRLTQTIDAYRPSANSRQSKKKHSLCRETANDTMIVAGSQTLYREGGPETQKDLPRIESAVVQDQHVHSLPTIPERGLPGTDITDRQNSIRISEIGGGNLRSLDSNDM